VQRKSFGKMQCPIARSLECVGEWWSILVLRGAQRGLNALRRVSGEPRRDIRPVVLSLLAWGNRHFAPEGAERRARRSPDGCPRRSHSRDPATGQPVDEPDYGLTPGPAANGRVLRRYQAVAEAPAARSRASRRASGTGRPP
jgi:hypothetical protein